MSLEMPLVSIIIVNYNGKRLLERCLSSVINTRYPNYEILVVDNSSSDGSSDLVNEKFPNCRVIQLENNMGFAIANNVGANAAKGKYAVFLNNDTVVTSDWLDDLVTVLERNSDIAIAQSMLILPSGEVDSAGDFATEFGRTYSSKKFGFDVPREILSARGAAMMIKRDFFLQVGGFDEDYFISFEDVELGWRTWILGFRVVMVPSSIVYHDAGSTMSKMSAMMTFNGLKNQLSLISTHFETQIAIRNLVTLLSVLFFNFLTMLIRVSKKQEKFSIDKKAAVRAVIWYMKNIQRIWKKHQRLNSKRKVTTKQLIRIGLITKGVNVK
jgi:GT2 family glycosyltransferase